MKVQKRIGWLVTCFVVGLNGLLLSQEPYDPGALLTFEFAFTNDDPNAAHQSTEPFGTYVAEMRMKFSSLFIQGPRPNSRNRGTYLRERGFLSHMNQAGNLTRIQCDRIHSASQSNSSISVAHIYTVHAESEEIRKIKFYAVTERDAKAMSQLYLNYAMQAYKAEMDKLTSQKESELRHISYLKKNISEFERELPEAKKEFELLKEDVLYRSPQEAEQAIQELNRILTIAQVDIAGIQAAIETIQDFQAQRLKTKVEVVRALESSLVEHTISLKAAQARDTTARRVRAQAIRYIELEEYTREGPQKLREARASLISDRIRLKRLNEQITDQIKPGVIDNKVTLYRITEKREN
jgi:hypothetical protein